MLLRLAALSVQFANKIRLRGLVADRQWRLWLRATCHRGRGLEKFHCRHNRCVFLIFVTPAYIGLWRTIG